MNVDRDFGHWFAGLVDGEGCFYIGNNGCVFLINMRADEGPMLEEIRDELGLGRIHYRVGTDGSLRNPSCRYEVSKKKECVALTHLFDEFPLRSKKARDYQVWREAAIAHQNGAHPSAIRFYAEDLAEARRYRAPGGMDVYVRREFVVQPTLLDVGRTDA